MNAQILCLPKRGLTSAEYEDAPALDAVRGRFALADGASASAFARSWAEFLVQDFVVHLHGVHIPWATWLPPLQQQWLQTIQIQPLSFWARAKLHQGTFATFLGLVVEPGGRWYAEAVGDTCFFHLREQRLLRGFPLTRSQDFNNTPPLVGTISAPAELAVQQIGGEWQSGDRFWLMTDALAQWFLQEEKKGRLAGNLLRGCLEARPGSDFAATLNRLRDLRAIRDDDVTLMEIQL